MAQTHASQTRPSWPIELNLISHSLESLLSSPLSQDPHPRPWALILLFWFRTPSASHLRLDFIFVCFLLCFFFPFCLTLYYYFIFLCYISLILSFFSEFYLVSLSFVFSFYIYYKKIVQKKREEKKVEKNEENESG